MGKGTKGIVEDAQAFLLKHTTGPAHRWEIGLPGWFFQMAGS